MITWLLIKICIKILKNRALDQNVHWYVTTSNRRVVPHNFAFSYCMRVFTPYSEHHTKYIATVP